MPPTAPEPEDRSIAHGAGAGGRIWDEIRAELHEAHEGLTAGLDGLRGEFGSMANTVKTLTEKVAALEAKGQADDGKLADKAAPS